MTIETSAPKDPLQQQAARDSLLNGVWNIGINRAEPDDWMRIELARPLRLAELRLGIQAYFPATVTVIVDGKRLPPVAIDLDRLAGTPPGIRVALPAAPIHTLELHAPHPDAWGQDASAQTLTLALVADDGKQDVVLMDGSDRAAEALPRGLHALGQAIEHCDGSLVPLVTLPFELHSYIRPGGPASLHLAAAADVTAECAGLPHFDAKTRWRSVGRDSVVAFTDDAEATLRFDGSTWRAVAIDDRRRVSPSWLEAQPAAIRAFAARLPSEATPVTATASKTKPGALHTMFARWGERWCAPPGATLTIAFPRGLRVGQVTMSESDHIDLVYTLGSSPPRKVAGADSTTLDADGTMVTSLAIQLGDTTERPAAPVCVGPIWITERGAKEAVRLLDGVTAAQLDELPRALDRILHGESCDPASLAAAYALPYRQSFGHEVTCHDIACIARLCRGDEGSPRDFADGGKPLDVSLTTRGLVLQNDVTWLEVVWRDKTWKLVEATRGSSRDFDY